MFKKCLPGFRNSALAVLMVVLGTSISFGDLLSNDDFEEPLGSTIVNVLESPFDLDAWGGGSSLVVPAENGITPNMGSMMLRMSDPGVGFSQVFQRVDVSEFAALIDADGACVDFSANFNTVDGGAVAGISVFFIPELDDGLQDDLLSVDIGNPSVNTQTLDGNLGTWEQVAITGTKIPVNTRSILVQLTFQNNTMGGNTMDTLGYADTCSMCIVECAECTFDVCQTLCVCEDGSLTGDFSVNGVFTNGQSVPGSFLLISPNAMPEGVEACFGNGHTSLVLDEPLMSGDSVTLGSYIDDSTAIFLKNAEECQQVTFQLVLVAADGYECCSVEVTVTTPKCWCWQIDKRHDVFSDVVCNDDGTVDFTYSYNLTSLFFYEEEETQAYHSFLIALGDEYFTPDFFDITDLLGAPLDFCDTATFETRIERATPGASVNFAITLHTDNLDECCIRNHEITAPVCDMGIAQPPTSFIRGDMNGNGAVQLDDVQMFVDLLTAGGYHVIADMNEDGFLTLSDIQVFVDALQAQ